MSQKSEVEMHECQNCGKRWPLEKLKEVKHLLERVGTYVTLARGTPPAALRGNTAGSRDG